MGLLLGLVIASGIVVALQLPLLHPQSSVQVNGAALTLTSSAPPLVWPDVGSAALDIPALGVLEGHHNAVVPIASLTKMMTAYVALKKLPLGLDETGPCFVVSSDDVETYDEMVDLGESRVPVVAGEQLCELDLLNGLLVHSAGNYAVMLANLAAGTNEAFVADMNTEASGLGLSGTHYDDVTGLSPDSVSTALDQARLATLLMKSPLVRSIVDQSAVTLPDAGLVASFTPDVGYDHVIGVKSGRTLEAGGCDVMAMTFQDGTATRVVYAVVLGQQGGNLLGPAGDAALALANSAVAERSHYTFAKGQVYGSISWGAKRDPFTLASSHEIWWWPAQGTPTASVAVRVFTSSIHRGEIVGSLDVQGRTNHVYALRATANLSPPTLLQRLR